MSKYVIVIASNDVSSVVGPFSTQGKAIDSVNDLAAKQKPKLDKGMKYDTAMDIKDGNFITDCTISDGSKTTLHARLSILPLVK